ncbi:tRNA 2-thiouridine(34) synthase MnmA [Eubacteriaceae bacterium ES3]|nr:tRNA 2-thiouridine(34) synthase MnmA [Eubacteriaceae bacterium ES3]
MKKSVLLGMSGGIDSTCCALRLMRQGYRVIGITFDFLGNPEIGDKAASIAKILGIEHYYIDCYESFEEEVITPFIAGYKNNETPNPCLICNQKMKFPLLFKWAKKLNCEYIATGHYARLIRDGRVTHLLKSLDLSKDQSYFLYHLSQAELKKLLLPLEDFENKWAVRQEIKALFPQIADGDESQGICFIPDNNHNRFLKERCLGPGPVKKGAFLDRIGNRLGAHRGALGYTRGQSVRLSLGNQHKDYFVFSVDTENNRVILGGEQDLLKYKISIKNLSLNEISLAQLEKLEDLSFVVCCKGETYQGKISFEDEIMSVKQESFQVIGETPVRAPATGQALVFYQGQRLLGGGMIIDD